jgi:hypothetical protein
MLSADGFFLNAVVLKIGFEKSSNSIFFVQTRNNLLANIWVIQFLFGQGPPTGGYFSCLL